MQDYLKCNRDIINNERPYYYPVIEITTNTVGYYNPEFCSSPRHSLSSGYQLIYDDKNELIEFSTYSELEDWVDKNIKADNINREDFPLLKQKSVFKEKGE